MKDEIKEKLLKEIEENDKEIEDCLNYTAYKEIENYVIHKRMLQYKLQQHEETSKAKDEKFIKILDEIEKNNCMYADMDEAEFWVTSTITQEEANIRANHTSAIIEEIKQRIKEE